MLDLFTPEFLKEINFKEIILPETESNKNKQYGKAESIRPKGKILLSWNREGASCDYFGNLLEPNVYFGIMEDGGTRTGFNGIVYSQDDIRKLLSLVC